MEDKAPHLHQARATALLYILTLFPKRMNKSSNILSPI
jgi:hypothetical protein